MNAQDVFKNRRIRAKKHTYLMLLFISLLGGLLVFFLYDEYGTGPHYERCQVANARFDELTEHETLSVYAKYAAYKDIADAVKFSQSCQKGIFEEPINELVFNYRMAKYTYQFGDYEEARVYADRVLEMNKIVDDEARQKKIPSIQDTRDAMREIKNGTY